MNDPTEETLEVLSRLMVRFANHQGISLNSICEKTGVDVGKYLGTPTKPSARSLIKFAYGMEMEPAWLVLLASKCARGEINEAACQWMLENLKSMDEYLEMAFQMFVGKSSIG